MDESGQWTYMDEMDSYGQLWTVMDENGQKMSILSISVQGITLGRTENVRNHSQ